MILYDFLQENSYKSCRFLLGKKGIMISNAGNTWSDPFVHCQRHLSILALFFRTLSLSRFVFRSRFSNAICATCF